MLVLCQVDEKLEILFKQIIKFFFDLFILRNKYKNQGIRLWIRIVCFPKKEKRKKKKKKWNKEQNLITKINIQVALLSVEKDSQCGLGSQGGQI